MLTGKQSALSQKNKSYGTYKDQRWQSVYIRRNTAFYTLHYFERIGLCLTVDKIADDNMLEDKAKFYSQSGYERRKN